jgi:flagella basal body P-ring formation protein FlgA
LLYVFAESHSVDSVIKPALQEDKHMAQFKSLTLLALVGVGAVYGESLQDLQVLRDAATDFIRAQMPAPEAGCKLHIEASTLDDRLRLPNCPAPEAFLPPGSSPAARTTVGIRCKSPAWSVYVPVTVESEMPVLVLRQPATVGSVLTANDVDLRTQRVPGFTSRYVKDITALAGHHMKNAAGPGTALTTDLLVPDLLIKRGQRVMLMAAVGGIEVRALGEAIADATPGGRVRVRNLDSQKIVEGRVESGDLVRMGL